MLAEDGRAITVFRDRSTAAPLLTREAVVFRRENAATDDRWRPFAGR